MGAVLIGGLIEGCLGLLARYWKKIITPIVAASVVTSIGFSLFSVGTRSFGGGYSESFGSAKNLLLGIITLAACLLFNIFAKSYWKQLSVLFGIIENIFKASTALMVGIALPHLLPFKMKFDLGAIIAVVVIFLVSAAETIGDTQPL